MYSWHCFKLYSNDSNFYHFKNNSRLLPTGTKILLNAFHIIFKSFYCLIKGIQGVTVTMMAEYFPPRFRTTAMITYSISFVSGLAVISGMSYFCRHWRWLQIVVAIPSLFVVCYSW